MVGDCASRLKNRRGEPRTIDVASQLRRTPEPDLSFATTETVTYQRPELPPITDIARYYALSEEARWYSNDGPCAKRHRHRVSLTPVLGRRVGRRRVLRSGVERHLRDAPLAVHPADLVKCVHR